jgi:hypothetical protein
MASLFNESLNFNVIIFNYCGSTAQQLPLEKKRINSRPSVAEVQIDITGVDNWYFEQFHAL